MSQGAGLSFVRAAWEVARKDTLVHLRTKRLFIVGGFYVLSFVGLSMLFASFFNEFFSGLYDELKGTDFYLSKANVVMGLFLFLPLVGAGSFLQLLGIVFAYDAIVREHEDKALFLLLSKPVSRASFVAGKFLGAVFAIGILYLLLATAVYFLVALVVGEMPSPGDAFRYYVAIGLIMMGLFALAAMALFVSSWSKSTGASITVSLLFWFIVLTAISQTGFWYATASDDLDLDDPLFKVSQYVNPSVADDAALSILLDFEGLEDAGVPAGALQIFNVADLDPFVSLLWMLAWLVVFLGLTVLVVEHRDFE